MLSPIIKLAKLYNKLSSESRAATWYTVSNVANKAVSTLFIPIYIRIMTMSEYGMYSYYHSLIPFLMIVCTLNMTGPIIYKGLKDHEDNRDAYISSSLGVMTLLSALVFFAFQSGYLISNDSMSSLLGLEYSLGLCLVVDVWSTYVGSIWQCRNRYEFKYKSVIIFNFVLSTGNLIFGLLAIFWSPNKLLGVLYCKVAFQCTLAIYVIVDILKKNRKLFSLPIWKYIIICCLPLLTNIIALRIVQRADYRVILNKCSEVDLAIYGLAYSISSLIYIFVGAFDNTLSPMITHSLAAKEFTNLRRQSKILLLMLCTIATGQCLLSPEMVLIFGTKDYYSAIYCIPPLVISVIIEFVTNQIIYVLVYYRSNKLITATSVFIAVSNVTLNLIFVPVYGFIAASYTTLASYIGYFISVGLSYLRVTRRNSIKVFNVRFVITIIVIALAICMLSVVFEQQRLIRTILLSIISLMILFKMKNTLKQSVK